MSHAQQGAAYSDLPPRRESEIVMGHGTSISEEYPASHQFRDQWNIHQHADEDGKEKGTRRSDRLRLVLGAGNTLLKTRSQETQHILVSPEEMGVAVGGIAAGGVEMHPTPPH